MHRAPAGQTQSHSPWSLAALIWTALVVAFVVANHETYFGGELLEIGDAAVNAINIEDARHFAELYGNYSRFQFNHPGPAFYYVYALGEAVLHDLLGWSPAPGNAHLATAMALQTAFFALAIAMFAARWRWPLWLPLALATAALHFGSSVSTFISSWPPDVILMPSLAFLVACISVASGSLAHLLPLVITGGFLFHGHVAQSMFVGCLGTLALFLERWHHRRATGAWAVRQWFAGHRKAWISSAALVLLFLLPPLLDVVLLGSNSNVATIFAHFRTNTGFSKNPLQSLLYFLSFCTTTTEQHALFTTLGPATRAFFVENVWLLLAWGTVWLGGPLALLVCRQRFTVGERRFLLAGYAVLAFTAGLCVVWGMTIELDMFNFNGAFFYGVHLLALLLLLAMVAKALAPCHHFLLTPAALIAAAVYLGMNRQVPADIRAGSGMEVRQAVRTALAEAPATVPRLLVFEHDAWTIASAVALELHRESAGFDVVPWWGFMFGSEHERVFPELQDGRPAVWWVAPPSPDGIPLTPGLSLYTRPAPIRPEQDEIRFERNANGYRRLLAGLSVSNFEYAWTNLPRVWFTFAPQHAAHDVRLIFDAHSAESKDDVVVRQAAEVYFNGEPLGRLEVGLRQQVEVRVSAERWNRAPQALLELYFPAPVPNPDPNRPRYQEWHAWALWSIRFDYGS